MTYVAIPFQIYQLTGSNFAVGAVGLVELVPLIVFGLYGGALADHVDRRLLLIWTGIAQAAFTAWLAINAFSAHPRLWEIFVVSGLLASASALQRPSPRGAAAAHRPARRDRRGQRAQQPRHAGRRPGRPRDRRPARRVVRPRLVLPRRHRRPVRRLDAVRRDAAATRTSARPSRPASAGSARGCATR